MRKGRREARRPFDRLALAGAMDAKTTWFRSSADDPVRRTVRE